MSRFVLQSYFYPFSPPFPQMPSSDKYVFQLLYLLLQLQHVSLSTSTGHADACTIAPADSDLLSYVFPSKAKTVTIPASLMGALAKAVLITNVHWPCFLPPVLTHRSRLPSLPYWVFDKKIVHALVSSYGLKASGRSHRVSTDTNPNVPTRHCNVTPFHRMIFKPAEKSYMLLF